eukprot:CAMPEP_0195147286 /NCGR_PEP_ID=MMETSP0448-20130528/173140_1 /TAXON_ID=66468 /ORGANISM="Heterocapsa triquestra, Strain CCMP 448" /LENGTH=571 /DNA_ID=CAMNT_0040185867 /DNA_START=255 /DNA_END=1968 /DNA_ORIENTATION=-
MWAWGHLDPYVLEEHEAEMLKKDICEDPKSYDFQWDAAGVWTYVDHRCMPLCKSSLPLSTRCASKFELFKVKDPTNVLFYTQLQESALTSDGKEVRTNYFLPFEHQLGISLQYNFDQMVSDGLTTLEGRLTGNSRTGTTTYFMGNKGEILRTVDPAPEVRVSLMDMLEMAGLPSDFIDTRQIEVGDNLWQNATLPELGGLVRIAGVQLEVRITCRNFHPENQKDKVLDGEHCYVDVQRKPLWVSHTELHHTADGQVINRMYHGVSVKIVTHGEFRVVDYNVVYLNLVSAMVLLQSLPRFIVALFATCCLGHLSNIYYDAFYDRFSIRERIASITVRLMADGLVFKKLHDSHDGISMKRVATLIREACHAQKDVLDMKELQAMIAFCFHSVVDHKNYRKMSTENFHTELFAGTRHITEGHSRKLSINDCSIAGAHGLRFESLVILFDKDRKRHALENLFTPAYLKATRQEDLDLNVQFDEHLHDGSGGGMPSVLRASSRFTDGVPTDTSTDDGVPGSSMRQAGIDVLEFTRCPAPKRPVSAEAAVKSYDYRADPFPESCAAGVVAKACGREH